MLKVPGLVLVTGHRELVNHLPENRGSTQLQTYQDMDTQLHWGLEIICGRVVRGKNHAERISVWCLQPNETKGEAFQGCHTYMVVAVLYCGEYIQLRSTL